MERSGAPTQVGGHHVAHQLDSGSILAAGQHHRVHIPVHPLAWLVQEPFAGRRGEDVELLLKQIPIHLLAPMLDDYAPREYDFLYHPESAKVLIPKELVDLLPLV